MTQNPTALMNEILVAVSAQPDTIAWRQNVGRGVTVRGQFLQFGVPGMGDIGCIHRGHHVELEVKAGSGRQTKEQKNWQAAVERAGGLYAVVRSVDEALDALRRLP